MVKLCRTWAAEHGAAPHFRARYTCVTSAGQTRYRDLWDVFLKASRPCRLWERIHPPFRTLTEAEDQAVRSQITGSQADIVIVSISTPKKEKWMYEHRDYFPGVTLIAVGAPLISMPAGLSGTRVDAEKWTRVAVPFDVGAGKTLASLPSNYSALSSSVGSTAAQSSGTELSHLRQLSEVTFPSSFPSPANA